MQKMCKRFLSILLTAALLAALFVPAASAHERFPDVSGHWAESVIESLAEQGVVYGYPDGTVQPNRTITQGEYASLLTHAAGISEEENAEKGSWAKKYESALASAGVLDAAESFSANEPITRFSIVSWTLRAMGVEQSTLRNGERCKFPDTDGLTEEEIGYLRVAADSGLLYGYPDGTAGPQSFCTRAEAFVIISRYGAAKRYVEDQQKPPVFSGTTLPQMSVSLEGPETAETYSPVEIKVHSKNVNKLEWVISGADGPTARSSDTWESELDQDGGTVTFFQPGHYDLHAKATSSAGQEGEYLLSIEVAQAPIRLTAPEEAELYADTAISAEVRSDVTDLFWSVTRDGENPGCDAYSGNLGDTGGTVNFHWDGVYEFTLSGKDGLGNPVSASCSIVAFQSLWNALYGPNVAFVGEDAYFSTSHFWPASDSTAEWQVLENGKVLDWNTVLDRHFESYAGGPVKFLRTGDFTVRLKIIDRVGHVTNMDVQTKVYESVKYSIEMPETAYAGDLVHITASGLDDSYSEVEWTVNGVRGGYDGVVMGDRPADYSGCDFTFTMPGEYQIGLSVPHESGQKITRYKTIKVYPVIYVGLTMQDSAYVGDQVSIQGYYDSNYYGLTPVWTLEKDKQKVEEADYLDGSLSSGSVSFLEAGNYKVTTSVTDELGRVFSASREIVVSEVVIPDIPELPDPEFTAPAVSYTNRDVTVRFNSDMGSCHVQWSYGKDGMEGAEGEFITGRLGVDGGNIRCNVVGEYTLTATVSDDYGQEKSYTAKVTVKDPPHIRMNPLDRLTYEERLDYVHILHLNASSTYYPDFTNTADMKVTFELLENGEPVEVGANCFEATSDHYRFQPNRTGDFVVRATAEDKFGNAFFFTTRIKAVPVVCAEISGLPETATTYEQLNINITPKNITEETVEWKLSYISEENAAPYLNKGLQNLWVLAKGWEEKELQEVTEGDLSDSGGSLRFLTPGIYCLRTSVTDQYDHTVERKAIIRIIPLC